jgi:hypothetical protein
MTTGHLTEARLNGDKFVASTLDYPAEFCAPTLAPTGMPAAGDNLLGQDALGPVTKEEHAFESYEQADLPETGTGFGSRRKLIAGTALVAVLGVGALAYFLLGSAGEQTRTAQTAEAHPITVQSSAESSAEVAPGTPEPSPEPTTAPEPATAVAGPDLPPSVIVGTSSQVAPDAPTGNSATPQTVPPWENEVVFLQRPGVNIRSTPSANGSVLGTAPKGTRFTATSREGDWTQVENGRLKGWINSQFLAPNKPL